MKSALMNDLIAKHPMNGVRYTKLVRAASDIKFLTLDEQEKFLEVAKRSHNYISICINFGDRITHGGIDWFNMGRYRLGKQNFNG